MRRNCESNRKSVATTLAILVICLVIVTGSTFSLFTSGTGSNIAITAGNVEMVATIDSLTLYSKGEQQTGKFQNGGTATLNDEKTELAFSNITPGDSAVITIKLENKSTVDLAYRVNWIVSGELADALTATAGGKDITSGTSEWTNWLATAEKSQTLEIAIELPLTAGNEWMNKSANIAFNVEAVQANGTGEYSSVAFVNTEAGLQAAVNSGATEIILNNDIDLSNSLVIGTPDASAYRRVLSAKATSGAIKLNLNGHTIKAANEEATIVNYANVVLTGGKIEADVENFAQATIENATVNATVASNGEEAVLAINNATGKLVVDAESTGDVVVTGGTFSADSVLPEGSLADGYQSIPNEDGTVSIVFNNKSLQELLTAAQAGDTVKVPAGEYTFPASYFKAGVTLECAKGVVFTGTSKLDIKGATVIGATFSNPSGTAADQRVNGIFKDCTFTGSNALRWCYATETTVFENCVFDGAVYGVHFDGGAYEASFVGCSFSGFNAFAGDVKLVLDGCTFKATGKSNYNGINLWGNATLTGCTFVFDGTAKNEWVDLCTSNQTVTFTNCVVNNGQDTVGVEKVVGNYGSDNTITINGKAYAIYHDLTALDNALLNGKDVILGADFKFSSSETKANSGYGATGVSVNGGTLDGNGHKLGITNWGTWDAAVHTTGGTIKNLTINSGMRGIFMGSATADVYIDNVTIDGTIYTFNSDGGNSNYGVYISNSTLNGWTSFSNVHKEVVFTNCTFGEGQGYAFCRPYNVATFENCVFEEGYEFDTSKVSGLVFNNCYYGDELITEENASKLASEGTVFFYNGLNNVVINGKKVVTATTLSAVMAAAKNGNIVIDAMGANLGDFSYDGTFGNGTVLMNAKFTYVYGASVDGLATFINCEFVSDHSYSANFSDGSYKGKVVFNNCYFDGWNSFGESITSVEMNGCTFETVIGPYSLLRFYQDAVLNNCVIKASFEGIDTNKTGTVVRLNNCTGIEGKIYNNTEGGVVKVGTWIVNGVELTDVPAW